MDKMRDRTKNKPEPKVPVKPVRKELPADLKKALDKIEEEEKKKGMKKGGVVKSSASKRGDGA